MSSYSALDSFLAKWHQRWPEWSLVEPFIAVDQRERCVAWFALLQEFDDILAAQGDTTAQDAKLAWWAQELRSWQGQRSRHPLGRVLDPLRAPWMGLADVLPDLPAARAALSDPGVAQRALQAYAAAVAAVEAVVFDAPLQPQAAQAVLVHTLGQRLLRSGQQAVPASIAGNDAGQAVAAWAQQLLKGWGVRVAGPRPRRVLALLARLRLQGLAADKPLTPHQATVLLKAWWAARGR
jgi:Phytoene/squalene synthetase